MPRIIPNAIDDVGILWEEEYDDNGAGEASPGEEASLKIDQPQEESSAFIRPIPSCVTIGDHLVGASFNEEKDSITTRVFFRISPKLRSSIEITLKATRNMDESFNPSQQEAVTTILEIPAKSMTNLVVTVLPDDTDIDSLPVEFRECKNIQNRKYALVSFDASQILISNGVIPKLLNKVSQQLFEKCVQVARSTDGSDEKHIHVSMLLRRQFNYLNPHLDGLVQAVGAENESDPLLKLFAKTPRAKMPNLGDLIPFHEFPNVPIQRARMVHADDLEQSTTHFYGATSEFLFQEAILKELSTTPFKAHAIEVLGSVDPVSSLHTAYLLYIDWKFQTVEKPKLGDVFKVILGLTDTISTSTPPVLITTIDTFGQVNARISSQLILQNKKRGAKKSNLKSTGRSKLHSLSDGDVILGGPVRGEPLGFEGERGGGCLTPQEHDAKPYEWRGYVLDTPNCPLGFVPIIVERAKELGTVGRMKDRPYVETRVPVMRVLPCTPTKVLLSSIKRNRDTFYVSLIPNFNDQTYKDALRGVDAYFHNSNLKSMRDYLAGRTDPTTPKMTTNLHELFGENKHLQFDQMTCSQKDALNYLRACPEGIAIIHGPFATGKTEFALHIAAMVHSHVKKYRVMVVTTNNLAVDDAAARYEKKCKRSRLEKKIVRLLPLQSEQLEFIKQRVPGDQAETHSTDDSIVNQFTAAYFLTSISRSHADRQHKGDPRRRLSNLSLAKAMTTYLDEHYSDDNVLNALGADLLTLQEDGLSTANTDTGTRARIRTSVRYLCKLTLADADAVFCTLNCASKATVYQSFPADFIILDEAGRAKEVETFGLLAFYNPRTFLFIGDHQQLGPPVFSVGRERMDPGWVNIYGQQMLISAMQRWISIGIPSVMLREQSRCHGDNAQWVNEHVYYNQLIDNCPPSAQTDWFRKYAFTMGTGLPTSVKVDGKKHPHPGTNVLAINVPNSYYALEEAGHSIYNTDNYEIITSEIMRMQQNPTFPSAAKILIVSFYNAQRFKYRTWIEQENLKNVETRSVEGSQGHQAEVVFVDFPKSDGAGFQGEKRRLCVAGSRAIFLCVYVLDVEGVIRGIRRPERNHQSKHIYSLLAFLEEQKLVTNVITPSSLCLRCQSPNHKANACTASDEERICNLCFEKGHLRTACPKKNDMLTCHNCGAEGHKRADCPAPGKVFCYNCKVSGHTIGNCTAPCSPTYFCKKCAGRGHYERNCTTIMTLAHYAKVRAGGFDIKASPSR